MNRVALMGVLTDPTYEVAASGMPIYKAFVKTTESWTSKDGKEGSRESVVPVNNFGASAAKLGDIPAGSKVLVDGKIRLGKPTADGRPGNAYVLIENMVVL